MVASDANVRIMREIARRIRARGVTVREIPGWEDRGHSGLFTPRGALDHHDASSRKSGEWGALGYITSARLSQFQGARCLDGRPKVALVGAGRMHHAGVGGPINGIPADSGNRYLIGVEWANDGLGEAYTSAAHEAKDVVFASILEVV